MTSSAMPWAVRLEGAGLDVAAVGGKAAALDRLVALGLPVPPCGALTVHAYRDFVAAPALRRLLDRLRAETPPPPERHAAARTEVDEAFLAEAIPDPSPRPWPRSLTMSQGAAP